MAAPTLNGERVSSGGTVASTSTITVAVSADVTGNLLVGAITTAAIAVSAITDTRGNTWVGVAGTSNGSTRLTHLVGRMDFPLRVGDTITITFASPITRYCLTVLDYSNAHLTVTTSDGTAITSGTSTSPSSGATAATTVADDIVVSFTGWTSATVGDWSAGAGYTGRGTPITDGTSSLAAEDKTVAATGAQTGTATLSPSRAWVQSVIAIRGSVRWYVDYNKADDTGAGTSWATAKKNLSAITPKSGDLITMAKSGDPAALTGTLTFTDNSTSVATSADLTGTLAAKDTIGPYTGSDAITGDGWWEVASLTASTITLTNAYCGTTRTTVTGYRMNGFDAGAPALGTTNVVAPAAVDGSRASPITITGGYDTGLDSRTGLTYMRVSGASKTGRFADTNTFHNWSYFGNARHATGMNATGANATFDRCTFASCGTLALALTTASTLSNFLITKGTGGLSSGQQSLRITNGAMQGDSSGGFALSGNFSLVDTCTIRRITGAGITGGGTFLVVQNCTINNCSTSGVTVTNADGGLVSGCTLANNTTADLRFTASSAADNEMWSCNNLTSSVTPYLCSAGGSTGLRICVDRYNQTASSFRVYSGAFGTIFSNTADARSGTCVEMQPSGAGANVSINDATVQAPYLEYIAPLYTKASGTLTVTVYVKCSSTYAGPFGATLGLRRRGLWASGSPTRIVPTTSYVQYTFNLTMTEVETVELAVLASGNAGSLFIDDIAWSIA